MFSRKAEQKREASLIICCFGLSRCLSLVCHIPPLAAQTVSLPLTGERRKPHYASKLDRVSHSLCLKTSGCFFVFSFFKRRSLSLFLSGACSVCEEICLKPHRAKYALPCSFQIPQFAVIGQFQPHTRFNLLSSLVYNIHFSLLLIDLTYI